MRHRVLTGLGCYGVSVTVLRAPVGGRGHSAAALLPCDDCHGEGSKQHPDHGRKRVTCLAATWGQFRWPRSTRVRCRGKGSGRGVRPQRAERKQTLHVMDGLSLLLRLPRQGDRGWRKAGQCPPFCGKSPGPGGSWHRTGSSVVSALAIPSLSGHFLRPCSTLSMCMPCPHRLWASGPVKRGWGQPRAVSTRPVTCGPWDLSQKT